MTYLMFATAHLQNMFRELVDSAHEVGGFLYISNERREGLDRRRIKSAFGIPRFAKIKFIEGWMVVPNVAPNRTNTWQSSVHTSELIKIANASAESLRCSTAMHFHTHPNGVDPVPSPADFEYWMTECAHTRSASFIFSEAAIVSRYSQWGVFDLKYRLTAKNQWQASFDRGRLLSWADERMWLAQNGGAA